LSRRVVVVLLAVATAATAFVFPGHPAEAVAADTPDTTLWVTNGDVHAVAVGAGRTYLGGTFDQVGPNTGFGVPLDPVTGALAIATSRVNGHVYAAVPDGTGGWFIGGDFTRVAGVSRHYVANVKADGTAGGWNPSPDLPVHAIAYDGNNRVYIGGEFTTVRKSAADGGGDASAAGLAATRRGDGSVDLTAMLPAITPGLDAAKNRLAVDALALSPDRSRLYVGGTFTALGGVARSGLAAVNLGGAPALDGTWAPQPDGAVNALQAGSSGRVYVGGTFSQIGGAGRVGFAVLGGGGAGAVDPSWTVQADGPVDALALSGGEASLYVGGTFGSIGGQTHSGLAKVGLGGPGTDGVVDSTFRADADGAILSLAFSADASKLYAGGAFGTIGGNSPRFLAALDPASGAVDPNFNAKAAAAVRAVATSPTMVYAGGDFESVGGEIRHNVAALGADGRLDFGFRADTDGEVDALLVNGSSLYIGGTYKNIGPYTHREHRGLTKVDAATGTVDPSFTANIDA
jgi:hypothetical protein